MVVLMMLSGPFLGFYYISSNFLQASGKASLATLVSVLRQGVILIPLLYLMNNLLQSEGIAYAHVIADISSTAVALIAMLWQYRALKREALLMTKVPY